MSNWNNHRVDAISNGESLSLVVDLTDTYTISSENPNFEAARQAWKDKNFDALITAVTPIKQVQKAAEYIDGLEVSEDDVTLNGETIHNVVVDRILEFAREGFDFKPLARFLAKLLQNPSRTVVQELYEFLERSKTPMPITDNGNFLAYKKVRSNYMDIYSGTVRYMVGDEPSMLRNEVDDDRSRTCSSGLHFCSIGYLPNFGYNTPVDVKIVTVEIDPSEVVSFPQDYNTSKGRCARMKVVGELTDQEFIDTISGKSRWASNYVPTGSKDQPVDKNKRPFDTRDAAYEYKRNFGGRLVDAWKSDSYTSGPRWWIVSETEVKDEPEIKYFWSRQGAREYRNENGGFVVDLWDDDYKGYDNGNTTCRWGVVPADYGQDDKD